jgi:hypothetical protein
MKTAIFKSIKFDKSRWLAIPLLAAGIGAAHAAWAAGADDAVQSANRQVLEQVRRGNRDTQKLMKILEPALKAHNEELERRAKAELGENARLGKTRSRENGGAKSGSGGNGRYGAPVDDSQPIVDPSSVPRELSFGSGAPQADEPASGPAVPASGGIGVSEVQFEPAPKAPAPSVAKPAKPRRARRSD